MSYKTILVEERDGVATITLNRPERLHAMSQQMCHDIIGACDEIEKRGTARVVVFTGSGNRIFSAGGDLNDMLKVMARPTAELEVGARLWDLMFYRVKRIEVPTLAVINGLALGGGCALAIACDLRIACQSADIGAISAKRGASTADAGISCILPRLVGAGVATEMMYTGRVLKADEAKNIGLYNVVVPDDKIRETGAEWAKKFAEGPTLALKLTKRALNLSTWRGLTEQFEYEDVAQSLAFMSHDFKEGVTSFLEKRPAEFKGC